MALSATLVKGMGGAAGYKGLRLAVVDLTVGATTDYSETTGLGLAEIKAAAKMTTILDVVGFTRRAASGGAPYGGMAIFDSVNQSIILAEATTATALTNSDFEQADFVNGDICRFTVVGY